MKHLFVSMSVKQNLSVSVFVHKCLMVLNDAEYTTFKMFVTQMSDYLFVISFYLTRPGGRVKSRTATSSRSQVC